METNCQVSEEIWSVAVEQILPKLIDLKSIVQALLLSAKLSVFNSLFNDISYWATDVDEQLADLAHVKQKLQQLKNSENERRLLNLRTKWQLCIKIEF